MKRRQHTPEQVIRMLEEGDRKLAEGLSVEEVCKHLEITPSTWFRWRNCVFRRLLYTRSDRTCTAIPT